MGSNDIRHSGTVERIEGLHVYVRIMKSDSCSACSIKSRCSTTSSQERLIDIETSDAAAYKMGDEVWVTGTSSMGAKAIMYGACIPFFILIGTLFILSRLGAGELMVGLCSIVMLIPYYVILSLNKKRMSQTFSLSVMPR